MLRVWFVVPPHMAHKLDGWRGMLLATSTEAVGQKRTSRRPWEKQTLKMMREMETLTMLE